MGKICPPPVGIGLTDLPNIDPPWPPGSGITRSNNQFRNMNPEFSRFLKPVFEEIALENVSCKFCSILSKLRIHDFGIGWLIRWQNMYTYVRQEYYHSKQKLSIISIKTQMYKCIPTYFCVQTFLNFALAQVFMIIKVQIFWEGHKNLAHLPLFSWHYLVVSNWKWKIGQTFVAFSEYLNFTYNTALLQRRRKLQKSRRVGNINKGQSTSKAIFVETPLPQKTKY